MSHIIWLWNVLQAVESDHEYKDLLSDVDTEMDDVVEECSGELSDESSNKS